MKYKVFVYGTLRKEGSLHYMIDKEPVAMAKLRGFKMYNLGAYPAITPSNDFNDIIVGEIYEITEEKFLQISTMERCAGYTIYHSAEIGAYLYVYDKINNEKQQIKSGDWIEFESKGGYDGC